MSELYKKYRPTKLSQLIGQDAVVNTLTDFGKSGTMPHTLLMVGPSGTGKTTAARILRKKLKCSDIDFQEINAAENRGINMIRGIERRMGLAPLGGKTRVWLVDEAHSMTGDAMSAALKIFEDTPKHVYFILCTTDPQKLKRTIITRSTVLKFQALDDDDMAKLLNRVSEAENFELFEEVREKITDAALGSPRQALVLLQQAVGGKTQEEQLARITLGDATRDAIELARVLLDPNAGWSKVSKILRGIQGLDDAAEGIRWLVLSFMATVAVKNNNPDRAVFVIDCFSESFFYTKRAGLILACHEAVSR